MRTLAVSMVMAVFALLPSSAMAAEYPPYEGEQFPTIHAPTDLEEYTWEVQLDEDQTLEQVDDQTAVVRWENGLVAFTISASPAHDATGATVPTALAVAEGNLLTFIVYHRAGNPAAGGAPFGYPISPGAGWEGGFATVTVTMPPDPAPVASSLPRCQVPDLSDRSLKASRRLLRKFNCRLGPIRGKRAKGAKVAKQYRRPGRSLPAGTEVGVKLG
jgi:hypothetical protein